MQIFLSHILKHFNIILFHLTYLKYQLQYKFHRKLYFLFLFFCRKMKLSFDNVCLLGEKFMESCLLFRHVCARINRFDCCSLKKMVSIVFWLNQAKQSNKKSTFISSYFSLLQFWIFVYFMIFQAIVIQAIVFGSVARI